MSRWYRLIWLDDLTYLIIISKNENACTQQSLLRLWAAIMLRFGTLDLQNRVTQNDVKLRVNNSKAFTEILLSSYLHDFVKHYTSLWVTNSKVEPLFFHFRVINSKLKNKKLLYDHQITQHMYCVMLLCFLIKTH